MGRRVIPLVLAVALAPLVAAACGTDAVDTDACKQIEDARCQKAPSCPDIQLSPPYYSNGTGVDACIRFYDVACLHGLQIHSDPGATNVNACVKAIQGAPANDAGCQIIEHPEQSPACAWLVPPNTPDASTEGGDAGDAGDGSDGAHPEASGD